MRKRLPAGVRQAWIQFVVRPKLWQKCAAALVATWLVYRLEGVVSRIVFVQNNMAVWWPFNAMLLAALLAARRRHWSWMLPAFAVGLGLAQHDNQPYFIANSLCNTLEVFVPALLLPPFRGLDKWLARPGVTGRFILLAMIAAPVGEALAAGFYSPLAPGTTYWTTAREFGSEDMLGFALFTPLLLALLSRETWNLFRPSALPRTVGLIGLLAAGSWLVFHQNIFQCAFLVYPLVLLVGTELGLHGAILAIGILAVISTQATVARMGPFASPTASLVVRITELQLYLGLSVTMVLPIGVARVRRLTTEDKLRRAWAAMEALATVDGLTGVANRRRFDMALEKEWLRAVRERCPIALLLIDADHFKAYNDNYGHLGGDACLRAIAKAISEVPGRPCDLVARYGGEEFAILLPGSDEAGAAVLAERARRAVYDLAIPHSFNQSQRVTVSIGIASIVPEVGGDPMLLIAVSDKALYDAKHGGRNRVSGALNPALRGGQVQLPATPLFT